MAKKTIYTVGGTVDKGVYIERRADLDLLELCRQGELAYILSSRQIGKSSLLVRVASQLESENVRTVLVDLSAIGVKVSRDEWYQGILNEIDTTLDLKTNVFDWWQSHVQLGPAQRLTKFFREVLLEEVNEPVVLFFDEIDSTLSLSFADDFYTAIRAVQNGRTVTPEFKRLSFVLVGVATPGDLITDKNRTPFNIGKRVDLNDFTLDEALPLAEGLGQYAEQALAWVFNFTGGHPYLTQRMCAYLAKSKEALDETAVSRAFEELFTGEQGNQDNNLQFVRDMLIKRSPDVRQGLLTYRNILSGKQVSDDERSILTVHLKLSGLVRSENGNLQVRNEIYKRVFDLGWVKKNTEIDWRPIVSFAFAILAIVALFILSSLVYSDIQYIRNQPNMAPPCFLNDPSSEKRLACLADLFSPDTRIIPYDNSTMARELFFSQSSWRRQVEIFDLNRPDPKELEVVVRGLYINLANVSNPEQGTKLLDAMLTALQRAGLKNEDLAKEIRSWLDARTKAFQEDYSGALDEYNQAISLNPNNPATLFERARTHSELGNYQAALSDYELVIAISPKSENEMTERSTATLTSTPVPTATATKTPTITPTYTVTSTFTPTSYLTFTATSISNQTTTPTVTPSNMPTGVPHTTPSVTAVSMPDDTPVQSNFSSLLDRIDAVKNDINRNPVLHLALINADPATYPNLKDWGIFDAGDLALVQINLVITTPVPTDGNLNATPNPTLRIAGFQESEVLCKDGKLSRAVVEVKIAGGLPPYVYDKNIAADSDNRATLTVESTDGQTANIEFLIPECANLELTTTPSHQTTGQIDAQMIMIPAGEFIMGGTVEEAQKECQRLFPDSSAENCKAENFADESPPHSVNLDAYSIDKYEVSNAQYQQCVEAGVCQTPLNVNSETHPIYYGIPEYANYPVIWVDRNMAENYCAWRGGRLPTEAEWEKAARGVSAQIYPWGNSFDGSKANSCDQNCPESFADRSFNDGYADVAPIDEFQEGASTNNIFNLSGNVSEWVADFYSPDYYAVSESSFNPQGPATGAEFVIRGGSWKRFPINLRLVTRSKQEPNYTANDLGFRCVMETNTLSNSPESPPTPTLNSEAVGIYITSDRSGKREIYYVSQQVLQVTNSPGNAESWSPTEDGNGNLYFTSNRDGKQEIYVLTSNNQINRVTNTPGTGESWSPAPDGNGNLYFTSNRDGKHEIYRLIFDTRLTERVTYSPGNSESWSPSLSRNGYVYFTSNRDGKQEIYRLGPNADTSRVTLSPGASESWGPVRAENDKLYFTSNQSGKQEIFALQNGIAIQITDVPDSWESWGPVVGKDGSLYFTSSHDGKTEVFILIENNVYPIPGLDNVQSWTVELSATAALPTTIAP